MKNLIMIGSLLFASLATAAPDKDKADANRWDIKTSLSPSARPQSPKSLRFADLVALENPPDVTRNDPRYQSHLIPAFTNSLDLKEGDIVSVTAWLHLVSGQKDGDLQIRLSDTETSGDHCLVAEIPDADAISARDSRLRKSCAQVRKFLTKEVLHGQKPDSTGIVVKPTRVTVTGQLFYNDAGVGQPRRAKQGLTAATLWELHPVISIKAASTSPL